MATKKKALNPIYYIVLATLILLAVAGVIIYSLGYRYIKTENVKFSGWVYDSQPFKGTLKYSDGTTGKLEKEKTSSFLQKDTELTHLALWLRAYSVRF